MPRAQVRGIFVYFEIGFRLPILAAEFFSLTRRQQPDSLSARGQQPLFERCLRFRRELGPLVRDVENVDGALALGVDQHHIDIAGGRGERHGQAVQQAWTVLGDDLDLGLQRRAQAAIGQRLQRGRRRRLRPRTRAFPCLQRQGGRPRRRAPDRRRGAPGLQLRNLHAQSGMMARAKRDNGGELTCAAG